MNKKDTGKYIAFFAGGILSALVFLLIFGIRILDVTYDDWLFFGMNKKDLIQHYMGFVNYRKSPWHFPIGLTDNIIYPHSISVMYTDSIPLFAIIFKLLSPVLPETFQYFGWFSLICAFLLGAFVGVTVYAGITYVGDAKREGNNVIDGIDSAKGNDTEADMGSSLDIPAIIYATISALFFTTSIIYLHRVFWHTALSAQWIVIAAIYVWLFKDREYTLKKSVLVWGLLSVTALLTEAYFLPMVFGVMVCSVIGRLKGIIPLITSAGATLLSGYIIGMFYGGVNGSDNMLGDVSFNYNSFINSMGYSRFLKGLPLLSELQYEGFSYLGIAIYVLLIIAIVTFVRTKTRAKEKLRFIDALPFLLFFICFTVFAGSPKISFFTRSFTIPLPGFIKSFWSIFRSTGRMIWPVCFLLMLFALIFSYKAFSKKYISVVVLVLALLLQVFENSGYISEVSAHYKTDYKYETALTDPAWEEIAEKYDHIMVYYPTIATHFSPMTEEVMIFASEHNMSMNAIYLSREMTDRYDEEVKEYFDNKEYLTDDKTCYLFLMNENLPEEDYGLNYYKLNGVIIGTVDELSDAKPVGYPWKL